MAKSSTRYSESFKFYRKANNLLLRPRKSEDFGGFSSFYQSLSPDKAVRDKVNEEVQKAVTDYYATHSKITHKKSYTVCHTPNICLPGLKKV
jgi:hypothetical protein